MTNLESVARYASCDGRDAYRAGLSLLDNPHPEGCREHGAWQTGWLIEERFTMLRKTRAAMAAE